MLSLSANMPFRARYIFPLFVLFATVLGSCAPVQEAQIDQLRLVMATDRGDVVKAILNRFGENSWILHRRDNVVTAGNLQISPDRFAKVVAAMEPYRRKARPMSSWTVEDLSSPGCELGEPYVENRGELQIHWTTRKGTSLAILSFGCNPDGNAARNLGLRRLFKELGVQNIEALEDSWL